MSGQGGGAALPTAAGRMGGVGRGHGGRTGRGAGALLWLLAVLIMMATAVHQRRTGPTHPLEGTVELDGTPLTYALARSGDTPKDAVVALPDPGDLEATLVWRRYPTTDSFARVPFREADGRLEAALPRQPAAGKLEYFVLLEGRRGEVRIPAAGGTEPGAENVLIRFKDPVPLAALLPHVLLMFSAILIGVRAGLGALAGRPDARRYAGAALVLMTLGGMVFGPIVQKHAFGAYWTGFPFGYDLTDNKTLLMWLAWLGAVAVAGVRADAPRRERAGRAAIAAAAAVTLVVYLVPHSLRGSELDYQRLEEVEDPREAVRTG